MSATEKDLAWSWGGRKARMWNGGIIFTHKHGCQETKSQQERRWIVWRAETNHFADKKVIDIRWVEKRLSELPPLGRLTQQYCVNTKDPPILQLWSLLITVVLLWQKVRLSTTLMVLRWEFYPHDNGHLAESYATSSISQTLVKLLPHRVIWSTTFNISTVTYLHICHPHQGTKVTCSFLLNKMHQEVKRGEYASPKVLKWTEIMSENLS